MNPVFDISQLHDCNSSPAQKWTISNGTMRAFDRRLDLAFADTSDSAPLQLHDCDSTIAQKWKIAI